MNEFPLVLYRLGDEIEIEGKKLATLIVEDAATEAGAIKDGWSSLRDALAEKIEQVAKKVKSK